MIYFSLKLSTTRTDICIVWVIVSLGTFLFADTDAFGFLTTRASGDISFGSESTFNAGATWETATAKLDGSHFVVAYHDNGNFDYGTAIIGTVTGNAIAYGSENVFNAANTDNISVTALDATHFVVAYREAGSPYYGTAIVGTVSGNTITYGSEYVFNTASTQPLSVSNLDATHFVIVYRSSSVGRAIIGTVTGNTIAYGAESIFNNANTFDISVTSLDASTFVVSFADVDNIYYGTSIVGSVSGTTITFGSEYIFNSANTSKISIASFDAINFVVSYKDGDNSYYGTALAGGISGTTISYGPACQFNDATGNWMLVTCLDNIHFSIAYKDDSNANYGTAIVGARSGNILTFGSKTVYNSAATQYISVAGINDTKFVVSYQDNNAYGRAIIGEMEHPTIEVAGGTSYDGTYTFVDAYNSKNRYRDSSGNEIRYESGVGTGQWQLVSSARAIIYTNYYECGGGYVVKPPNSGWQGSIPLPSLSGDVCTSLANDATTEVPTDYIILNVYPNPFNSKISIEYTLPSREKVDISVYDIKGQFISEIFEGVQNAGSHKLIWDCTYHSSGIYFLSLSTGGNTAMQKVMLIK